MQARLRIDILLAVQHSQSNPLNVVAVLSGFDTAVRCLDRVATELPAVHDAWLAVESIGSPQVRTQARETVLALTELLQHTEPAWHHPIRRLTARAEGKRARKSYEACLKELNRLMTADAGARRRERRAARNRQVA